MWTHSFLKMLRVGKKNNNKEMAGQVLFRYLSGPELFYLQNIWKWNGCIRYWNSQAAHPR